MKTGLREDGSSPSHFASRADLIRRHRRRLSLKTPRRPGRRLGTDAGTKIEDDGARTSGATPLGRSGVTGRAVVRPYRAPSFDR